MPLFDPNENDDTIWNGEQPGPDPGAGGYNDVPPPLTVNNMTTGFAPAPPPGGGGGKGAGGFSGGGDFGPSFDFAAFPRFDPKNANFVPLSFQDAQNEPGYKFAADAGRQAIERSAAAKGITRTSGNLKDLSTWADNFAAQNYDAANRRALQTFSTNYGIEKDRFAPILSEAQMRFQAEVQRARDAYNRGTIWNAPHVGGGGGITLPDPEPIFVPPGA